MTSEISEEMLFKYSQMAKEIENSALPMIFSSILRRQKNILFGMGQKLNNQIAYIKIFNRFYEIFHTCIHLSNLENEVSINSATNILTRCGVEISLVLDYLLCPNFFPNVDSEDERKIKLNFYLIKGYLSKEKEFNELKQNDRPENNHHLAFIQSKIKELEELIKTSPAYRLIHRSDKKKIGKKLFIAENRILSYEDMLSQVYRNKFFLSQYKYLSGHSHCGFESLIFEKTGENNRDERGLILYTSCAIIFLLLRFHFKIDFDCFEDKECAVLIDFLSLI